MMKNKYEILFSQRIGGNSIGKETILTKCVILKNDKKYLERTVALNNKDEMNNSEAYKKALTATISKLDRKERILITEDFFLDINYLDSWKLNKALMQYRKVIMQIKETTKKIKNEK